MISLRAHGDSTGDLNDFGYSARHDVEAAIDWLEHNHPGRPVVVWGQSLGSAAAIFAAGELGDRVRGYILESPYQDLRTAVWNRTQVYLPPVLDVLAYAGLLMVRPLVLPDADRISPVQAITEVPPSIPVLFLAGRADTRARPEESKALAERIRSHAQLVTIADADHLHLANADPAAYRSAVMNFVASCRSK
jgi:pimeloyl-ACP methyl ester carboxylesterase